MPTGADLVAWLAGASAFLLVFCIWTMGVVGWYLWRSRRAERVQGRLGLIAALEPGGAGTRTIRLWRDGEAVTTTVPTNPGMFYHLDQVRRELGWQTPVLSLMLGIVGLALVSTLVTFLLARNLPMALGVGALVVIVPWVSVTRRVEKRNERFESQFADALGLATRSLRAGHPLLGAFRLVSEEMEPPVSVVFSDICQQQSLGVGMAQAIRSIAAQSSSADMKLFAAATAIQIRSGGNIADMMERLQEVVRDRIRLHRKARALTAEAQLSKRIMVAIPFALFLILSIQDPTYIAPMLGTRVGTISLIVGGCLLILGVWMINRIAKLRY